MHLKQKINYDNVKHELNYEKTNKADNENNAWLNEQWSDEAQLQSYKTGKRAHDTGNERIVKLARIYLK